VETARHHPVTSSATLQDAADDAVLVAHAKHGDARAFTLLYQRYVERVYAYVVYQLSNREVAEEATQTIFFRALRGLAGFRDDAAFGPWLFAIARNVITDVQRSRRHASAPLEMAMDVADPEPTPEEHAMRVLARDELLAARDHCLTQREREFFDLLLAGLTHAEMAHVMGRRPGAIRTAHWRLIAKLRRCLDTITQTTGVTDVPL
jgi:RNA polymerase sigma-70 factor (ECF subfamily)